MRTIAWNNLGPSVQMIDQRLLPEKLEILSLHTYPQIVAAIQTMVIRGAPAIGAAGAFGIALAAANSKAVSTSKLWDELDSAADALRAARPTAVNLAWAVKRTLQAGRKAQGNDVAAIRAALLREALLLADEDVAVNKRMGAFGAALLPDRCTVIHHCNTGALATVDYGTALGVIRAAHESGKKVHVLVDETRPRLQGSRLTAWELQRLGIPYDIISDSAAGHFLSRSEVDAVLVGADRVAANGDVANKIGTYMLALAADASQIPFYCVVPTSTIDLQLATGAQIPIEERSPDEVLNLQRDGRPLAPSGSTARNPAFDITPAALISRFITETGVLAPPFPAALQRAHEKVNPS
ncbi:MAG: S-methyl-5-thioribose-1-phosphate isomerase [Anaerolineales bacterium]|nr:S-methyl-5-thioribose-1-phosphate isomerase [Anaerolineales bacterium]